MDPTIPSTGDPITAPAPTVATPPPAPAPVISPAQTVPSFDPNAEARIRHFQSESDRYKQMADQKAAEAEQARREAELARVNAATVAQTATQTAEQALAEVQRLRNQVQDSEARELKNRVLLEEDYRALAPYAGFIQATNDETQLRTQLNNMKAARDADLAKNMPPAPTTPTPPPAPPFTQPMQPARPQPSAQSSDGSAVAHIQTRITELQEAYAMKRISPLEFDQQMQQVIELANADAARQLGLSS